MDMVFRALAIYLFLVVVFKVAGRRALLQMTSFDLILLVIIRENILDGNPVILVENGVPLADKLKKVDVSCDDILVSARQNNGITKMSEIKYAIFERNGHISIIPFEK